MARKGKRGDRGGRGAGAPARGRGGRQESDVDVQELITQAVELLERGQYLEAVLILEQAREDSPREAIYYKLLGTAYAELGILPTATERWEEAGRLDPDDPNVPRLLAALYGEQGFYTHALRSLRRHAAMEPDGEAVGEADDAREQLEGIIRDTARELGVPAAEAERGTLLLERALRAQQAGDYLNVMRLARDASRVLPNWAPARNTLALAQFELGKPDDALATTERTLAADPDDVYALANKARFLLTVGRRAEALPVADHLWSLVQASRATADAAGEGAEAGAARAGQFEAERAAEAFALLEQDDRVAAALDRLPRETMSDRALLLLGVALANLRRKNEALEVFQELEGHPAAARIAEALRLNEAPPGGRFVGLTPAELMPGGYMDTLLDRLPRPAPGAAEDREAGREEVRQLLERAPTVYPAMLVSLWMLDEVSSAQAVATLLALGTPEALEALRGFAFGRLGPDDARLHAALRLREEGHVDTRRGLLLWLDDRYQEVYPPRYELVDASELDARPYPPEVRKLMARAVERHNEGELEAAAKLYRQVLAQDPDNQDAEQHLGLIDLINGDRDAAEGHFARAFELNPDFVLARTTLASLRIGQRRLDEARQLLVPLADRTRFTVGELASYLFTSAELAAADGDPARARSQLRLLLGYVPDHAPARLRLRDLEREEAARKQAEQGQQGQQGQGGLASSLLQVPGRLNPFGRGQGQRK